MEKILQMDPAAPVTILTWKKYPTNERKPKARLAAGGPGRGYVRTAANKPVNFRHVREVTDLVSQSGKRTRELVSVWGQESFNHRVTCTERLFKAIKLAPWPADMDKKQPANAGPGNIVINPQPMATESEKDKGFLTPAMRKGLIIYLIIILLIFWYLDLL